jgi:hypothetical protein
VSGTLFSSLDFKKVNDIRRGVIERMSRICMVVDRETLLKKLNFIEVR